MNTALVVWAATNVSLTVHGSHPNWIIKYTLASGMVAIPCLTKSLLYQGCGVPGEKMWHVASMRNTWMLQLMMGKKYTNASRVKITWSINTISDSAHQGHCSPTHQFQVAQGRIYWATQLSLMLLQRFCQYTPLLDHLDLMLHHLTAESRPWIQSKIHNTSVVDM